jgi:hypothetical protein
MQGRIIDDDIKKKAERRAYADVLSLLKPRYDMLEYRFNIDLVSEAG